LLRALKKCRLGGQNYSGSSRHEKLLKIVNVEINKETDETDWRSRWNRRVATNIHLDQRIHTNMETKERRILKAKKKRMLRSRKREKNSHQNIIQKKVVMNTIVGNYI